MNRRKISAMVAAALITSQVQNIAFAETINNKQDTNVTSEVVSEVVNENEEIKNIEETKPFLDNSNEEVDITEENKIEEEQKLDNMIVEDSDKEESIKDETYNLTGKLEVDLNFATPIKIDTKEKTNIKINLKNSNGISIGEISLGNDITSGKIGDANYYLEALDSTRKSLANDATEIGFYHLTIDKIPVGTYSIEILGSGYTNAKIDNIVIENTSKRVLVGTSDNIIVLDDNGTVETEDDVKEEYFGTFLVGDVDGNNIINDKDYEELKTAIKEGTKDVKYDLNRDGKVDITDLTYIHQNLNKEIKEAKIIDTDIIIDPNSVKAEAVEGTSVSEGSDITDLLKDNGNSVSLKSTKGETLSEEKTPTAAFP